MFNLEMTMSNFSVYGNKNYQLPILEQNHLSAVIYFKMQFGRLMVSVELNEADQ